jgi:hypothetical protein
MPTLLAVIEILEAVFGTSGEPSTEHWRVVIDRLQMAHKRWIH